MSGGTRARKRITGLAPGRLARKGDDAARPGSVAAYIAQMTRELSKVADDDGLEFLAYLLKLAHLEAQAHSDVRRDGEVRFNQAPG